MKSVVIHINEMQKIGEALARDAESVLPRCTAKKLLGTFLWLNPVCDITLAALI